MQRKEDEDPEGGEKRRAAGKPAHTRLPAGTYAQKKSISFQFYIRNYKYLI